MDTTNLHCEVIHMNSNIHFNGELLTVGGHKMHIFRQGQPQGPALVFMSGHCTIAPVYDFKVLYEKLAQHCRIIVLEKFGYGYSDICDSPCDIDTLVSLQRQALSLAGEAGPYVLIPHSMSGLEAIWWKQQFPDEVAAIIGIDMATPLSFSVWTDAMLKKVIRTMKIVRRLRLGSILCSVSRLSLTENEISQHELLKKRNAFNCCCIKEAREVLQNARIVGEAGSIACPMLLFCSDGKDQEQDWVENQQKFAADMGARLIAYDCGHYIHHFKSAEMCGEIIRFIHSL